MSNNVTSRSTLPRIQDLARRNGFVLVIAVVAFLIQAAGPEASRALRYERAAILHGQWWRLLTGNLVHMGWSHLWLNLAGLLLVWLLFKDQIPLRVWIASLLVSFLGVGLGLLWGSPHLAWYVGLSGALHGLFVTGAVLCVRQGYRFEILLLVLVAAKLVYEQNVGPLPGSEEVSGGHVAVDAHLYGAISGALLVFLPKRWIEKGTDLFSRDDRVKKAEKDEN